MNTIVLGKYKLWADNGWYMVHMKFQAKRLCTIYIFRLYYLKIRSILYFVFYFKTYCFFPLYIIGFGGNQCGL